jgi:hypothetical protein
MRREEFDEWFQTLPQVVALHQLNHGDFQQLARASPNWKVMGRGGWIGGHNCGRCNHWTHLFNLGFLFPPLSFGVVVCARMRMFVWVLRHLEGLRRANGD